ncbi:MAG: hypothetical protein LBO69_03060 [Ignavibacteria bacterium]|jgi:hypothetical protein|nr:hypothetical protein [Ignavibacteria bacterium]
MKKFLLILLTLIATSAMASAQDFAGGNGTAESPYLISTVEHLNSVRMFNTKTYADIHFSKN